MRISVKTAVDKCIWVMTVFLLVIFLAFSDRTWGRYAFFGVSILIILLTAVYNNGVIRLKLQAYHGFGLLFVAYIAINAMWAWAPSDTIEKVVTIVQILVCSTALYIYYEEKEDIHALLMAVMWAGYLVVFYAIGYYGLDTLADTVGSERLGNEFANVNAIGMVAALACVLQVNELIHKRNIWSVVMTVPAIVMIAATQSRKALVFLIAGVLCIYAVNTMASSGKLKSLFKILFFVTVAIMGLRLLLQLPIFAGVLSRVEKLLAFWSDGGEADASTLLRQKMGELGIAWFKKYPIGGIGIGCPHILAYQYLDKNGYLHNNFVELLCGGGVLGFAAYYVMYAYLFINLFKYRHVNHEQFAVGVVWLGLMLFMNYGMVTYYTKLQWYYLMFHFLNVNSMKKKHREMLQNAEKTAQSEC